TRSSRRARCVLGCRSQLFPAGRPETAGCFACTERSRTSNEAEPRCLHLEGHEDRRPHQAGKLAGSLRRGGADRSRSAANRRNPRRPGIAPPFPRAKARGGGTLPTRSRAQSGVTRRPLGAQVVERGLVVTG